MRARGVPLGLWRGGRLAQKSLGCCGTPVTGGARDRHRTSPGGTGSGLNQKTPYTALHVIRDDDPPTRNSIPRRRLAAFAASGADILVAAEGAVQRGHNILNARRVAALGAVFYLARIHPPDDDATFPLSLLSREAMRRLRHPSTSPSTRLNRSTSRADSATARAADGSDE